MPERLTDTIRSFVVDRYIAPARRAGKTRISVRVKDVRAELSKDHVMRGKSVVICQALQGKKWLQSEGLQVESIDGPPSNKSPTVVMHYALISGAGAAQVQSSDEWASEIVGKLKGLLREEIAAYGGAEAFLKWVRSEDGGWFSLPAI